MSLALVKTYFGFTSLVNPEKAAKKGFKLFQKVRKKEILEREKLFYSQARSFELNRRDETIHCFEMGNPNGELVILVHGWDSNAGSMSKIANKMVSLDKRVIALNLPGHAYHKNKFTNLIECRDALMDLFEFIQPSPSTTIISHSFGSAVTANALAKSKIKIKNLIFLTNPNLVIDIFYQFKSSVGLNNVAFNKMIKMSEARFGIKIQSLDVQENLKNASYDRFLMMHDVHDKVLPIKYAKDLNNELENSQLIQLEKVGHYKMLWNDEVVDRCGAFAQGREVF